MNTGQNSSNFKAKIPKFRLVFLRGSYFSIGIMEIFAVRQYYGMLQDSIKSSSTDVKHGIVLISVLPAVFLHQLASAFIPIDSFAVWVDLALLLGEFCFDIWILTRGYAVVDPLSDRTAPFLVLASYVFTLCLFALIILRIVEKIWTLNVARNADISGDRFWYSILYVLSGKRIWKPHYEHERKFIITCRALLTLLFLIILPIYVTFNVVIQPIQKAALMSVRETRSLALPPDFKKVSNPRWNVVITNFPDKNFEPFELVQRALKAITVVKLINNNATEICYEGTFAKSDTMVPDHISFDCLNATAEEIALQGGVGMVSSTIKNFVIAIIADYNQTFNSSVPLMNVRLGLTNDAAAIIRGARPAVIAEHENFVGTGNAEVFVRRELTTPWLATLGVFSGWNTYLLIDANQYFNDPAATTYGYAAPGVSSVVMNMNNLHYGYRVVEDYIEKTVLDGLSTIGGLFVLMSSITTLLFGRSLQQIIFGSRPLSLFGVVHNLDKDQIKKSFGKDYPGLRGDLNNGFIALLRDHIVDIDLILAEKERQATTGGNSEIGLAQVSAPQEVKDVQVSTGKKNATA